jgi:hypothetical protein
MKEAASARDKRAEQFYNIFEILFGALEMSIVQQ